MNQNNIHISNQNKNEKNAQNIEEILLYNRETRNLENEEIFSRKLMQFIYGSAPGEFLSRTLLAKKFISWFFGIYQDTFLSKGSIKKFASNYSFNINEMEYPIEEYQTFNQFFTRKLKSGSRIIEMDKNILISPADSKLLVYHINKDLIVPIKGMQYSVSDLLKDKTMVNKYDHGLCMIFRLAPVDYHRFCYIDHGKHGKIVDIPGLYYSVHPYALSKNYPIFPKNHRQYCIQQTENFDDVVYIDVGAMFVGTIFQHNPFGTDFKKGQEKGYFKFGGSTIVLLFKHGIVDIDNDIMEYSKQGIETIVKYGSAIGTKIQNPDF